MMASACYRIDESGYLVEDVALEDEDVPEDCVTARPPDGYYEPRYVDGEWTEGASEERLLEVAKRRKRREMEEYALEELDGLFETGDPAKEAIFVLCAALSRGKPSETTETIRDTGERLFARLDEIRDAETVEEVENVEW